MNPGRYVFFVDGKLRIAVSMRFISSATDAGGAIANASTTIDAQGCTE